MAATFEVHDATLKQALLTHFIQQIETQPDCLDQLLMSGVSGELIDHLRSRATITEICRVAAFSQPRFTVSFDDRGLMASFEQTARFMRDEQIKEYLARNGASIGLLQQWFSLSQADAESLRSLLAPMRSPGRPKLPEFEVRDAIHKAWGKLAPGRPEREAYYELHQHFRDLSVSALYQVVHEMDASPQAQRCGAGQRSGRAESVKAAAR